MSRLVAEIVLQIPDGRTFTILDTWNTEHGDANTFAWYWRDGNAGCDCNRSLYLLRQHGVRLGTEPGLFGETSLVCGDTIKMVSFTVQES